MEFSYYLNYFQRKPELRVDFHNHCQTGSNFRQEPTSSRERVINLFFEEGFPNLKQLVNRTIDSKLDIIYIANFSELRYENWTSEHKLDELRQEGYDVETGSYYVFIKNPDGKILALGKSQEVPTKQGHLLISGIRRGKIIPDYKSLEETLEEINDNELKILDHPYAMTMGVLRKTKGEEESAVEKVDALERNGNCYFPISLSNIKTYFASRKYKKPFIVNSDGHHPKDIGNTYNIFNSSDLKYENEREFRDSINNAVRENKFKIRFRIIPPWRVLHHIVMIGLYIAKDKIVKIKEKVLGLFRKRRFALASA